MDRPDNYIKIFTSFEEQFALLSNEDLGQLIRALLSYSKTGEEPQDLSPLLKMAFAFIISANQTNKKCASHFNIYTGFEEYFNLLSDEDLGQLIRTLLSYSKTGEKPQNLSPLLTMAFALVNSINSKPVKRGAPIGNKNKKDKSKINSNQLDINSKSNKINSNQLEINSNQLKINSKSNEINSNQLKNNSAELNLIDFSAENPPIVDNFVDNSPQTPPPEPESPILYNNNKQDKTSLVSLVCQKRENINNNMRAYTHEEVLDMLNQRFLDFIKLTTHPESAERLKMVIQLMADLISKPPNKKYTSEQIKGMVFNLTSDELAKICGSFRMNDVKKPQIYLLSCLVNTDEERLLRER